MLQHVRHPHPALVINVLYLLPLPLPHTSDGLMPSVLGVRLLTVESKGLEHRCILDGKQDGLVAALVGVFVPGPGQGRKKIALAPIEALSSNDTVTLAGKDMIHRAARLTVCLCMHTRPDELNPTGDGRERMATRGSVGVFHRHIVEWASVHLGQLPQGSVCLSPLVMYEGRQVLTRVGPGRLQTARAVASCCIANRLAYLLAIIGNGSKNMLSRERIKGISKPSIQIMGPVDSLPWSCQVHDGVSTKSPGSMGQRSPSTVV